jgi:hypothetical protein
VVKTILDLQNIILVLCGVFFAIRFIYTNEIYIQINGYSINTLELLIQTIVLFTISKAYESNLPHANNRKAKRS